MTALSRITAPYVDNKLDKHLQYHEDKLDPTVKENTIILFGEKGDNGLCKSVGTLELSMKHIEERLTSIDKTISERVSKIERNINWVVLLILALVITSVLKLVIK